MCGEWENVPEYFLPYLHKGMFLLVLTTSSFENGEVAGKPEVDKSLQKSMLNVAIEFRLLFGEPVLDKFNVRQCSTDHTHFWSLVASII